MGDGGWVQTVESMRFAAEQDAVGPGCEEFFQGFGSADSVSAASWRFRRGRRRRSSPRGRRYFWRGYANDGGDHLAGPTKAREGFMVRVRGPVQVVAAGSAELERVWTVSVRERRSWRARRSRLKKGMTEYARPMGRSGESRVRVARPLRMGATRRRGRTEKSFLHGDGP